MDISLNGPNDNGRRRPMKRHLWQGSVSAHRHSEVCQAKPAGSRAQSCGGPFDGRSVRTGWHCSS